MLNGIVGVIVLLEVKIWFVYVVNNIFFVGLFGVLVVLWLFFDEMVMLKVNKVVDCYDELLMELLYVICVDLGIKLNRVLDGYEFWLWVGNV